MNEAAGLFESISNSRYDALPCPAPNVRLILSALTPTQMVLQLLRHPLPQQNRSLQGEIDHFTDLRVLFGLRGRIGLRNGRRLHGEQVQAAIQERSQPSSHLSSNLRHG